MTGKGRYAVLKEVSRAWKVVVVMEWFLTLWRERVRVVAVHYLLRMHFR